MVNLFMRATTSEHYDASTVCLKAQVLLQIFSERVHQLVNELVRTYHKNWLLFIGCAHGDSVSRTASFSFPVQLKKKCVTLTDLIRFQAQRIARAGGFDACDLKGLFVMV